MPRYGDDQCAQCGGIRVAKSTLCADCLAALCCRKENDVAEKNGEIVYLRKKLAASRARLNDALAYGFKKNQENVDLHRIIDDLTERLEEV